MGEEIFSTDLSYNYNEVDKNYWSTILPVITVSDLDRGATMEPTMSPNSSQKMNTSLIPVLVTHGVVGVSSGAVFESNLIIPLYVVIFLLAVVGNSMVLITLAQNKRMRTVTNVYLLNLAVSDLLLGVFCMPFTLVGQVLRNFVFGEVMCKLIPYFQAVSVSVGVWTLVAISLERYFAICRPLKSRRWQTQCHAYKMIAVVWLASLFWNLPILVVSRRQAMRQGKHKCREEWPSASSERAYNMFLDVMLLLVPLVIMTLAYSLIVSKLWKGLRREIRHHSSCRRQLERNGSSATVNEVVVTPNDSANGSNVNIPLTASRPHHSVTSLLATRSPASAVASANANVNANPDPNASVNSSVANAAGALQCSGRSLQARTKPTSVKLWLIKGMVQVRLPNSSRNSAGDPRCAMVESRASLLSQSTGPPETSRLIVGKTASGQLQATDRNADVNSVADDEQQEVTASNSYAFNRQAIRSNYMDKSIEAKKKVIRMLFVIIAEFFVCWAPLHVLNTWYLYSPEAVYNYVGSTGVSLVQLLAYISSCCNPITYCFMNRKFRQAFIGVFDCYTFWSSYCWCCAEVGTNGRTSARQRVCRDAANAGATNNSDVSGNDSTMFVGRTTGMLRSEVLELEGEDRV